MDQSQIPAISVQGLVGFGAHLVIDKLDLDVRHGEILGIVGASGGDKSVLLRTILGLLPKRAGQIRILGNDPDTLNVDAMSDVEQRWGVLFQQGALFSALTVRQNVEFLMCEYLDLPDTLRTEVAVTKLRMVGLSLKDVEKSPAELSGGMVKRVALARALALEPDIVFLDEPTSGLDPIAAADFDILIRTLQRTLGLTVFMATHDLDSLEAVCDRVAALADGRIVALGPMSTMRASQHPWVKAYFNGARARDAVHAAPRGPPRSHRPSMISRCRSCQGCPTRYRRGRS